jgi:hypothetical protein
MKVVIGAIHDLVAARRQQAGSRMGAGARTKELITPGNLAGAKGARCIPDPRKIGASKAEVACRRKSWLS